MIAFKIPNTNNQEMEIYRKNNYYEGNLFLFKKYGVKIIIIII